MKDHRLREPRPEFNVPGLEEIQFGVPAKRLRRPAVTRVLAFPPDEDVPDHVPVGWDDWAFGGGLTPQDAFEDACEQLYGAGWNLEGVGAPEQAELPTGPARLLVSKFAPPRPSGPRSKLHWVLVCVRQPLVLVPRPAAPVAKRTKTRKDAE